MQSQQARLKNYILNLKPNYGGKFLYYCVPFRRKIVLQNMQHVLGEMLTPEEIKKLALAFYSHLFLSLKENLLLRFMSTDAIKKRGIVLGEEHLWQLLENQKVPGAIVLTGHFGNWEFAPIAGIMNFTQFNGHFFFVRKTLTHKWLEKIVFNRYYRAGLQVIPKKNSLMQVCDRLDQNNVVVFVMDQHASIKAKDGIMVEFFGKKAGTFRSVATIARHTGVPVVPARSYRRSDGHHVIEFFPALQWQNDPDPTKEIYINTRLYNEILENMVLDYPDQWLWMHRRWKKT